MLHIAGGIILALVILALLPYIINLVGILLLIALAGVIAFFFLGTETGQILGLILASVALGTWLLVKATEWLQAAIQAWKIKAANAGGWTIALGDMLFELTPAFTELQKIQKIATRQIRADNSARIKRAKEHAALEKFKLEIERVAAEREQRLARYFDRLVRKVKRLEKKYSKIANLQFYYRDRVYVYRRNEAGQFEKAISIACSDPGAGSHFSYRIEDCVGREVLETLDLYIAVRKIRELLRKIVAEQKIRAAAGH